MNTILKTESAQEPTRSLASPETFLWPRLNPCRNLAVVFIIGSALGAFQSSAQNYAINWYKIAGGGGTSSNSQFVVSSTIGQPDAGVTMTGGSYALTGGFWTFAAVQTPGAPLLNVAQNGPNSVLVWWLANDTIFKLQTNSTPVSASWINYTNPIASSGGTNSVTISPPRGNLFFRLAFP